MPEMNALTWIVVTGLEDPGEMHAEEHPLDVPVEVET